MCLRSYWCLKLASLALISAISGHNNKIFHFASNLPYQDTPILQGHFDGKISNEKPNQQMTPLALSSTRLQRLGLNYGVIG